MRNYNNKALAIEAIYFLKNHPAFCMETDNPICSGFYYSMQEVSRTGYIKCAEDGITVFKGSRDWERFKDRLDKEDEGDPCPSVEVSYQDLFGKPWVGDHIEFWWETTFYIWKGLPVKEDDVLTKYERMNWHPLQGPEGKARSFETMAIKAAEAVRKAYGNFCCDDFLTPEEKQNHETEECYSFQTSSSLVDGIKRNPKYIEVDSTVLNLRWLKWFMATEYAKKNWDFEFEYWNQILKNNGI